MDTSIEDIIDMYGLLELALAEQNFNKKDIIQSLETMIQKIKDVDDEDYTTLGLAGTAMVDVGGLLALCAINSAILEAHTEYINAKKEYLTAKNNLAEAEAQINLTDKDTWKEIGITNQTGRDAYVRKQTKQLLDKLYQARLELDYREVQLQYQENKLKTMEE